MNFFERLANSVEGGVYVIAEACDNHMGSTRMAKALADMAKACGADAVKFQHHLVTEEMLENELSTDNFDVSLSEFLHENALTLQQHYEIKEHCDAIGITYLCTPFSYAAAIEINDLVPFFKIGSGEFQDYWFIDRLLEIGKPCVFSTGMSTHSEITAWVARYKGSLGEIALLNCLSEYPPSLSDMNLNYISELSKLGVTIGHSDHTQIIGGSVIAASLGARIVERHITLSNFVTGPDSSVSLDTSSFAQLIRELKVVRSMMGTGEKIVNEREQGVRTWAYRSIVSARSLQGGDLITDGCIKTMRPGVGIPSSDYQQVIGRKIIRDIPAGELLSWSDFE